jgi:hypothetical protein
LVLDLPGAEEIENMAIKKAQIVQSGGGYFLTFPPGDNHVWQTEGLPIIKTDNSSLEERLSTKTTLFQHHQSDGGWTAFR